MTGLVDQDELDLARFGFFVNAHEFQVAVCIGFKTSSQSRSNRGQTGFFDQVGQTHHEGGVHQTQSLRQLRRHHHAATHSFAMQPFAIAQTGFNGVAERVPKVQNSAKAGFAFILADDPGFDLATAFDGVRHSGGVARQ